VAKLKEAVEISASKLIQEFEERFYEKQAISSFYLPK
jgi:hypothetical protein